ncbi:hypothetical protein TVAG_135940 [Trichomonas vaginalis G3]|uniref:Uncharacterized protein n=1 Tax=Trichomonas vaginalis (strain ATCC PRA-98 / G3) TaxID=412133 RepID=A2DJ76_TRIV3|nr:hypothetical protein TVAGG3_0544190 [Trichomonas vaginalis G3]EAY19463.1 hypothetical protein TVAG_135940 [Trichomonas vaginalis G3]KAI5520058.1 hypothetical protein TVAGG3_0544190 [Trichomonas vaginalis G3]|eukprot:XP_001580449.1 hypothetical protein [Trichomonas vaginalis G3]
MLALLSQLVSSTVQCPIGTQYFYAQEINKIIAPNEWYYFMSSMSKTNTRPVFLVLKPTHDVTVYQSRQSDCPDEDDILVMEAKANKLNKVQVQVYNEYGFMNFGVKNYDYETYIEFHFDGQGPEKIFWTPGKKLFCLIVAMIVSLVTIYIYLTNPVPEHEKND